MGAVWHRWAIGVVILELLTGMAPNTTMNDVFEMETVLEKFEPFFDKDMADILRYLILSEGDVKIQEYLDDTMAQKPHIIHDMMDGVDIAITKSNTRSSIVENGKWIYKNKDPGYYFNSKFDTHNIKIRNYIAFILLINLLKGSKRHWK